jgi:hypothetical protein
MKAVLLPTACADRGAHVDRHTDRPAVSVPRATACCQFESRPDDLELGHLVDSTIWVSEAHPAFVRATASRLSATTSR